MRKSNQFVDARHRLYARFRRALQELHAPFCNRIQPLERSSRIVLLTTAINGDGVAILQPAICSGDHCVCCLDDVPRAVGQRPLVRVEGMRELAHVEPQLPELVEQWEGFDAKSALTEALGMEVRVLNDAEASRIHLVADTVGGDGLWNLIQNGRPHHLPVDLAVRRHVDDDVALEPRLAGEAPARCQAFPALVALLDRRKRGEMPGRAGDAVLGEAALAHGHLPPPADCPPAANRIEVHAELPCCGQHQRAQYTGASARLDFPTGNLPPSFWVTDSTMDANQFGAVGFMKTLATSELISTETVIPDGEVSTDLGVLCAKRQITNLASRS